MCFLVIQAGCPDPETGVNTFTIDDLELMSETGSEQGLSGVYLPATYTVRKGDTLFSIARKFGLVVADLKNMNGLVSDTITAGMVLRLKSEPAEADVFDLFEEEGLEFEEAAALQSAAPQAGVSSSGYRWPVAGTVISKYAPAVGKKGILIAARPGAPVYAAGGGTVVFTGYYPALGNTVVIEHPFKYLTLYGHLGSISVDHRQKVVSGQVIGTVGTSGNAQQAALQFRVYLNYATLTDPQRILPLK